MLMCHNKTKLCIQLSKLKILHRKIYTKRALIQSKKNICKTAETNYIINNIFSLQIMSFVCVLCTYNFVFYFSFLSHRRSMLEFHFFFTIKNWWKFHYFRCCCFQYFRIKREKKSFFAERIFLPQNITTEKEKKKIALCVFSFWCFPVKRGKLKSSLKNYERFG